ncbi:EF-hand [Piromyces finnis]|uniref:EF-hand n=1 Tax=Piromyces finnis TaxID=1754191 RepID=A0A1Y1UYK3_9FUNG|nr:EF-hand [Piromyces finnis]|eukprot:ORX43596.1 EF-hand [Piromyces finnis]
MFYPNAPLSKIMFNKYDTDGSGSITVQEFKYMAYDLGYYLSDTELEFAVKKLDKTGSDSITYDDFKKWWGTTDRWNQLKLSEENMAILSAISGQFQMFDVDKSGSIDKHEFQNYCKEIAKKGKITTAEEEEMFRNLDINHDGNVSFNELIDYLYAKYEGDLSRYFS